MSDTQSPLQFVPFSSCINPSFWHKFTQLKLDVLKLDESTAKIWGYYTNLDSQMKPIIEVDSTSFNNYYNGSKFYLPYHGLLINKNTIEEFKECDKKNIIKEAGDILENDIKTGRALKDPALLNLFLILSYADLKKYNFYYWFAFPVLNSIKPSYINSYSITKIYKEDELIRLCKQYLDLDVNNRSYFLIETKGDIQILNLDSQICPNNFSKNGNELDCIIFAFSDSTLQSHPGWQLRNFILLILYHCPYLAGKILNFISFRLNRKGSEIKCDNSIVWEIKLPDIDKIDIFSNTNSTWVGFEANERDKMGPRLAKMKDSMSPTSLAEASVDLNLKLMKWRLLPDVNLDKIKSSKCLLLGAGTLGCAVARNLLAWGVRTITFVDNGTVSYSNPVRQNLFTFEDCIGNKQKATTAAENLSKIFPGVTSGGHNLTIPMPGHPVGESLLAQTKEAYEKLVKLISEHDVIFLLMDSRESRWLPTLICASLKKMTINAALGFDTYLIMRHGVNTDKACEVAPNISKHLKCVPGNKLGCYFCNDITAPGDSLKDRTLDQQCTVTRPGVSNIAAALAVELAISVIQHEQGPLAPAFYTLSKFEQDVSRENECNLGIIPHSIRGFLSMFNHVLPATERYNQCIACSDAVVKLYEEKTFEFLLEVFQKPSYLEEVTGLSKMYTNCGELEDLDFNEEDSS
ncbi:ubiquitin-activating enzyme e1 [Holotrichia oblita]|uniref:Ubiquitin-activating enzyme e1 n=1 Tax=Holotrichia oblita TaxID=644536 RepID=A0ACB9T4W8_HOLOL|nr:ubiquitin-activating enzyme e1 [Holotrichia oblita]